MKNHTVRRSVPIARLTLVPAVTLLTLATILSSCGIVTFFPEEPESHRLVQELEKWPDEYYWLVEAGVSSRVMGIREGEISVEEAARRIDELLGKVKERWSDIGPMATSAELITYLRENNLGQIADVIEETLVLNQALVPSGESHGRLEAMAIKRGLVYAYREVKSELRE